MKPHRTVTGWRAAGTLAGLVPAVLVLGVLTSLGVVLLAHMLPDTWSHALLRKGPETVTRRCLQIWAVLLLPLLLRHTGWRGWHDIGWRMEAAADRRGAGGRDVVRGVALGLLTLGGLALFAWWRGWRIPSPLTPGTSVPLTLLSYAVSGLAVAVIEETVARGMLFRLWARVWGWVAAAMVSSVLFGLAHFIGPARAAFDQPAGAWSVLQSTIAQIPETPHFGLRLLNLTLLGLVLCAMVWRTRTVWLAVGAHAAWVWCIKVSDLLSDPTPLRPWSPWWGIRADATDALAGTGLMLGLLALCALWPRRAGPPLADVSLPTIQPAGCGPYRLLISADFDEPVLRKPLEHLAGQLAGPEAVVLSSGRHRVVRLEWPSRRGLLTLAVKAFGRQTRLKDGVDRWRGTKAQRSFRIAGRLRERGVGTPAPVACLERWQGGRLLESYYLSVYQPDLVSLRDELIRLYRHDPLCAKFMTLLQCVADAVRDLHAAGVRHNDLGNQNICLRRQGDAAWGDVQFLDLNRARLVRALSMAARARDLSRLTLPSELRRVFVEMYWDGRPALSFQRWERIQRQLFALHTLTRRFRHPLRERRPAARGADETYPPDKDIWIWDDRSAQAISALTTQDRHRYHPCANSWQVARAVVAGAWPVRNNYRALRTQRFAAPVALAQRIGIALEPTPATADAELRLLAGLGRIPVILRFYHHAPPAQRAFVIQLAQRLHAAGHPVSIALVQDRRAVLEPARWRDFVADALEPLAASVDWVEVGHAVNRVKWGLWRLEDYPQLLAPAIELQRRHPGLRLMGPAVIDFEYHYLMALLRLLPAGFRFQALSHHLYVDRRGAPENRQGVFAAAEKIALARAIAAWSPACEPRLIVSEVNWPLRGTGVWSPVGSPYETPGPRYHDPSVTEQDYADYLLRYLLIALCSGLVERVYWWRLVARGFGLVDDTEAGAWRLRPAYQHLRFFLTLLGQSTFERQLVTADGVRCYQFRAPDGARHAVIYAHPAPARFAPPFAFQAACSARGEPLGHPQTPLDVGGSPLYLTGIS